MKFLFPFISLLILLFLFDCTNAPSAPETNTRLAFNPNGDFKIGLIYRDNSYPSSETDTTICEDWAITKRQMEVLLTKIEPIDASTKHHTFDHLPCTFRAKIQQNNQIFKLMVNAGAWLEISAKDTTWIYRNSDTLLNKLFLSEAGLQEE